MPEYIERENALGLISKIFDSTDPLGEAQLGVLKCSNAIRATPAVDVVEVIHGEWFTVEYNDGSVFEECSRCGAEKPPKHNTFCPKCGAKMSNKSIYFKKVTEE